MNELLENPEFLAKVLLIIVLCMIEIAVALKCVKIMSYLYDPSWAFDRNLTITPLVKNKNYRLSWVLTILLMPIILLIATLRSPNMFWIFLSPSADVGSAVIIVGLIYLISVLLVAAALLERLLPRRVYTSRKQLWSGFTIYVVVFITLFICATMVTL